MTHLRPLLAGLLALILMVGSVQMAVARNEMAGARDLALCGSTDTVQADPAGNPVTKTGHGCPHCMAAQGVAILSLPPVVPPAQHLAPAQFTALAGPTRAPADGLTPFARGPPPLV